MNKDYGPRLARLERRVIPRDRCWQCGNYPTRIVGIDPDTGAMISETMPESGCPACGRPPRQTVGIAGVDVAAAFPPMKKAG